MDVIIVEITIGGCRVRIVSRSQSISLTRSGD
jgi:hypothetical protein